LVLVVAGGITWFILERTLMGRAIFAVGGDASIAERLGYNVNTVRIFVFAYAGLLAGIAGIMHVASNRLANPFDLAGSELEVIAAVVLGGARITGGSGTVGGTILGVILITLVNNILILVGIPSTWQLAIIGAFIVLAGSLSMLGRVR
ncbi:MAG: ABC transporter permease, partial [Phyllobacterium sp.]